MFFLIKKAAWELKMQKKQGLKQLHFPKRNGKRQNKCSLNRN